jgi:hypothetical protein
MFFTFRRFGARPYDEKGRSRVFVSADSKEDDIVKSLKRRISVIPAKAGIQLFQILKNSLDSGFHRSDDFLREHQRRTPDFRLGLNIFIDNSFVCLYDYLVIIALLIGRRKKAGDHKIHENIFTYGGKPRGRNVGSWGATERVVAYVAKELYEKNLPGGMQPQF